MDYAKADKRLEQGAWLCELDECAPIYDAKLELELIRRAKTGDREASDRLIRAQLKMVVGMANRVSRPDGMEQDEVISAGVEGVLEAIRNFKTSANGRLSTYAEYRARVRMWSYVKGNDSLITVPNIAPAVMRMEELHGVRTRYLSEPARRNSDGKVTATLADTIPSPAPIRPGVSKMAQIQKLFDLAKLTYEQRAAMMARYLTQTETPSCVEVGAMLGITPNAAQKRIKSALYKLQLAAGIIVTTPKAVSGRKRRGAA